MGVKNLKTKSSPFKTATSASKSSKSKISAIKAPENLASTVDELHDINGQIKHLKGEETVLRDSINAFAQETFSDRFRGGLTGNFRIEGETSSITYIVQDASSGISSEEKEDFANKWGDEAADALIVEDFASIKFDTKVLEANYDAVVAALQTLPEEVFTTLFKPMSLKATKGAAGKAAELTESAKDLADMLRDLKIKTQIRA